MIKINRQTNNTKI